MITINISDKLELKYFGMKTLYKFPGVFVWGNCEYSSRPENSLETAF